MLVCRYVTVLDCVRNMPLRTHLYDVIIYMYDPTRTNERPTATSESTYSTLIKIVKGNRLAKQRHSRDWKRKTLIEARKDLKKGPKMMMQNAYNVDAISVIRISIPQKKIKTLLSVH